MGNVLEKKIVLDVVKGPRIDNCVAAETPAASSAHTVST